MSSEKWLIFVDTNIFLDFYRQGGESAARQLEALDRHQECIITCDQVLMEFLNNRQAAIVAGINQIKKPTDAFIPSVIADAQAVRMLAKHVKDAERKFTDIQSKFEGILREPGRNDQVYKTVTRMFENESTFNLCRPNNKRYEIRELARKRFDLGYPPRKKSDNSIGDAINWEWIIHCACESKENHHVLVVSRDGDYGVTYNQEPILNDWLRREFRERVGSKRKIELTNRLTNALKKLDEVVTAEDKSEEDALLKQPALRYYQPMLNFDHDQNFENSFNALKFWLQANIGNSLHEITGVSEEAE